MQNKVWAIDIDGVVTANPAAISWLTYHLAKNENNNIIIMLSWRDGSDAARVQETKDDLQRFGITYHNLVMAPNRFENDRLAAFWKIAQVNELKVDVWLDNDLKHYVRDYQMNLDTLLPAVHKINI